MVKAQQVGCREQALEHNQPCRRQIGVIIIPLLKPRRRSRGVSLWTLPLLLRLFPGVLAALARSLNALIACGVVGAALRKGSGRVAGPPRGVLPVPGVRKVGVFRLPGVGPALRARRNGVVGAMRASLLGVLSRSRSGESRCFLRADSDIVVVVMRLRCGLVDGRQGNASDDALSPTFVSLGLNWLAWGISIRSSGTFSVAECESQHTSAKHFPHNVRLRFRRGRTSY